MGNQTHRAAGSRLILVKHAMPQVTPGEPPSTWPLSPEGWTAAAALARKLSAHDPVAIVASEEAKAFDTARSMAQVLGLTAAQDAGLGEHLNETGDFLPRAEIEARIERLFAVPDKLVHGEETGDQARERFAAAIARQRQAHPTGTLVLDAHGRVIALWASRELDVPAMPLWRSLGLASALVIDGDGYEIVN
jgi:broad specificity phosphatase PhoE